MLVSQYNTKIRPLVSLAVGGIVVLIALSMAVPGLLFPFSQFIIPIVFGVMAVMGTFMVMPMQLTLIDEVTDIANIAGLSPQRVASTIAEGRGKVAQIESMVPFLIETNQAKVGRITDVADDIFKSFEINPETIRQATDFLHTYLDSTIEVLTKVRDLKSQTSDHSTIQPSLEKFGALLEDIETSFEQQAEKLLQSDVRGLDVEMRFLGERLSRDGFDLQKPEEENIDG